MELAAWDDGYILDTDMRREDPLYYYLLKEDWKQAVGIEVQPHYNEAFAKEASISIFAAHLDRPAAASLEGRKQIFLRVLPVLIKRFPNWKQITLRDDWLTSMPEIGEIFKQAKFISDQAKSGANKQVWRRPGWFETMLRRYR